MAGIRASKLAERFVSALEMAGATVIPVTPPSRRPFVLSVVVNETIHRLEVNLWTITSGGKGRNRPRECRIQRTAVDRFILKAGVRTIMGGWHEETGVFAFWDVRRHLSSRGRSPSSQISLDTLEAASSVGMATELRQSKEGEEIAVAAHPDYLLWYVEEYKRIYDCGSEVTNATELVDAPPEEERQFIDSGGTEAAQSRRHQLVSVVRNFRDARFRPLVLRAYNYRCCLTGVALRLVDAAHIVPVSDPTSTDDPKNGLALNPLVHRAYDCGLLGILPGGKTLINRRVLANLRNQRLSSGLEHLESQIPSRIRFPTSLEFVPPDDFLRRGLEARGWFDAEISEAS